MFKLSIFNLNIDNNIHVSVSPHWALGSTLLVMELGFVSLSSWNLQTESLCTVTE